MTPPKRHRLISQEADLPEKLRSQVSFKPLADDDGQHDQSNSDDGDSDQDAPEEQQE